MWPISLEMRRKAQGESRQDRPWPCACSWLHWQYDWQFWWWKGKEGQRPALNHCSSSSGTVLNECVETRKLVRLQLTCLKQSQRPDSYIWRVLSLTGSDDSLVPKTIFLSSCNTDCARGTGWAIVFQWCNSSMIWLGPQPGQRWGSAARGCGRAELGGVQPAEPMGLGEAGVGAAGAAVLPLAALHHAGNLQARHDWKTAVPHLRGRAQQQAV